MLVSQSMRLITEPKQSWRDRVNRVTGAILVGGYSPVSRRIRWQLLASKWGKICVVF